MEKIRQRVSRTFSNRLYKEHMERAGRANWLGIQPDEAFDKIQGFLRSL